MQNAECEQCHGVSWVCPACGLPSFTSSFFVVSALSMSNSFESLQSTTGDANDNITGSTHLACIVPLPEVKLPNRSDEVCHCLFHLLEKDKSLFHMSLRPRGHSFDLPRYQYNLIRKSFIYRNLYSNKEN